MRVCLCWNFARLGNSIVTGCYFCLFVFSTYPSVHLLDYLSTSTTHLAIAYWLHVKGFSLGTGALSVCPHGAHPVLVWVLTASWTSWVGCLNGLCIVSLQGPLLSLHLDLRTQGNLRLCSIWYMNYSESSKRNEWSRVSIFFRAQRLKGLWSYKLLVQAPDRMIGLQSSVAWNMGADFAHVYSPGNSGNVRQCVWLTWVEWKGCLWHLVGRPEMLLNISSPFFSPFCFSLR